MDTAPNGGRWPASGGEPVAPHGGVLVDRIPGPDARQALIERLHERPAISLSASCVADLECLAVGAFSPLRGFLGRHDYESVLESYRLATGTVWSLPVTLPLPEELQGVVREGDDIGLRSPEGTLVGALEVEEVYLAPRHVEARAVFGTEDASHPGVRMVLGRPRHLVGGPVTLLAAPQIDAGLEPYRRTPAQVRDEIGAREWRTVVGFQTRNPLHRSHEYLLKVALELFDGVLLHPLVGHTKGDDVPADVRMRAYQALVDGYFPVGRVLLSIFPGAMRYAGPREALHHALVRKNYGCTHLLVGRDHAGVGAFYDPYAAHRIFDAFTPEEIGIQPLRVEETFFCRRCEAIASGRTCPHDRGARVTLSGTMVRERLARGEGLPAEFSRPEVAEVLERWVRS